MKRRKETKLSKNRRLYTLKRNILAQNFYAGIIIFLAFTIVVESYFIDNINERSRNLIAVTRPECSEPPFYSIFYVMGLLYSFIGVAIVCDVYFEPALGEISERLGLSDDVAGATFMAAGSSAPELFTSIVDVFGPSNAIGLGTIVGSAMFNLLIIIALSATVAKGSISLDWRPIARDSSFYLVSIFLLIFFILWSGNYCLIPSISNQNISLTEDEIFVFVDEQTLRQNLPDSNPVDEQVERYCNYGEVGVFAGLTLSSVYGVYILFMIYNRQIFNRCVPSKGKLVHTENTDNTNKVEEISSVESEEINIFEIPSNKQELPLWLLNFPLNVLFYISIPNCTKPSWKNWYLVCFFMCISWMAVLSHFMVTLATRIGCLIGINTVIMGLTILAAGTSVPDALASMSVARKGLADMAIANAVGSNILNILLGLGLPWAIADLALGRKTHIERGNVTEYVFILFGTLILYILSLIISRWKMTKHLGYFYIFLYSLFLIYVVSGVL